MPTSRSAKEICREDPDSISCRVATNREKRKKKRAEKYGEPVAVPEVEEEPEAPPPEDTETEAPKPKPATERRKYLDEIEKELGI